MLKFDINLIKKIKLKNLNKTKFVEYHLIKLFDSFN